jgi:hypothetical protein
MIICSCNVLSDHQVRTTVTAAKARPRSTGRSIFVSAAAPSAAVAPVPSGGSWMKRSGVPARPQLLCPYQALCGAAEDSTNAFVADSDGVQLSFGNSVHNMHLVTSPEKRAIFNDTAVPSRRPRFFGTRSSPGQRRPLGSVTAHASNSRESTRALDPAARNSICSG